MKHEEDQIHVAILAYLRLNLPPDATPPWHTPNGGSRDARTGAKMKKLGAIAGFPDLAFIYRGKFYALEVKTAKGKLGDVQKLWRDWIEAAGGAYAVVKSIDDAKAALALWRIKPMAGKKAWQEALLELKCSQVAKKARRRSMGKFKGVK